LVNKYIYDSILKGGKVHHNMSLEVLTTVTMKSALFFDVNPVVW